MALLLNPNLLKQLQSNPVIAYKDSLDIKTTERPIKFPNIVVFKNFIITINRDLDQIFGKFYFFLRHLQKELLIFEYVNYIGTVFLKFLFLNSCCIV